MAKGKSGRPRKDGERYPCGKLKKPGGEGVTPAQWQRICNDAVILTKDTRLASALGKASFHRELTARQAAAGFRVAQIYGSFEAMHGARRQMRSPGYEIGHRGGSTRAYDPETMSDVEEAFFDLQREIPHSIRGPLEVLCVDNCAISSLRLDEIRWILNHLANYFKFRSAKDKPDKKADKIRMSAVAKPQKPQQKPEISDRSLLNLPDLDDEEMTNVVSFARALKDRSDYRREPSVRGGTKRILENANI